jgi:hypothetical protein
MCFFEKKIIILTIFICCPTSVCAITVLTVIRLGHGIEKPEAGHQTNEARVTLCFTKRFIGLFMKM